MDKETIKPIAYSGEYIDYKKNTYTLRPETSTGSCKSCDLVGGICTSTLTDYCRQGFIFKKIKV